jgi:hypothetical protein
MATTEQQRQEVVAADGQEVDSDQLKRGAEVSEPLRRIAEAVAAVTEDEAAAALGSLGALMGRRDVAREVPRTPLPPPTAQSSVRCEVEWV